MIKLQGIGASDGVAIGDIYFLQKLDLSVKEESGCNILEQTERFENAQKKAILELAELYKHAEETDYDTAQVFEVHQMLLEDDEFVESVAELITAGKNAEYAVKVTADSLRDIFLAMDDPYMRARSADIIDVSNRLIKILKGLQETNIAKTSKIIVVADDLLPRETIKLDKSMVVGFVTRQGSKTSHSAILARTMGIPSVVSLRESFDDIPLSGKIAIDGGTGKVIVDPTQTITANYNAYIARQEKENKELEKQKGKKAITASGHECKIGANIGSLDDIDAVKKYDADCVGLFRSEFVYLESGHMPTEKEQFMIYKKMLSSLNPLNVIVRTLDLGADKQAPYFNLGHEENPALGYRAIRICLNEIEIFRTQLRALLRASVYGNLSIMFPMISHYSQIIEAKNTLQDVKNELKAEGIEFNENVSIGCMIETPASVMIADRLAKEVDFFSIGTNDLTQYTLAVDRMNSNVEQLFDSSNEAVLKMIELTAKSAHDNGIWVGICGESASDPSLTNFYMDLKIDELSVSPSKVLKLKKAINEHK